MQDFLFDTPYWFLGMLAVVGAILWINGNSRREPRLRLAAYGVFLAGIALFVVSHLVETDKEKVIRETRELASAVEKRDKSTADRLLSPDAEFLGLKKGAIVDRIAGVADQFHLKSIRLSSFEVTPSGKDLSVVVSATADVEFGGWGGGVPSTWELLWEKTPSGWLLRELRPISLANDALHRLKEGI